MVNTLYAPYRVGGAEQSTQLLSEGLSRQGHDVAVACTSPKDCLEIRVVNDIKVYGVPLRNVYWPFEGRKVAALKGVWHVLNTYNPWMQKALGRLLDVEKPDIVHTHNLGGFTVAIWKAAAERKIAIVHTTRDYSLLCPRNMFRSNENCQGQCWTCQPFAAPRCRLSRHVDVVVGISDFILNRHLRLGYFSNAHLRTVIHNPYNRPEDTHPSSACSHSALRFGFLGRLSPMKGVERLLEAVTTLDDPPEVDIAGTGDDGYVRTLRNTYDHPNIRFLGFVDPTAFFSEIDVLVVPSVWHEPFGRVVIEAYAHATPVIASQRGGLPEIVCDGTTGWTFDPVETGSLRTCIERARNEPHRVEAMAKKAKAYASDFEVERHVDQYAFVYEAAQEHGSTEVQGAL